MASPGPDMLLVARHAIRGGMPLALACIAGIVVGIGCHPAFARLIRSPGIAGWLEARARWLDRVFGVLLLGIAVPVAIG